MNPGTLLVRADSNVAMGTGHVMRCLALAQAWQDTGGSVVFAMAETAPSIRNRLAAESVAIEEIPDGGGTEEDASQTVRLAQRLGAKWVVVDGYQFNSNYQLCLKEAGFRLLFLDDYGHTGQYFADLVLNQNLSVRADLYEHRAAHTRLLLGPRYSLLRREFLSWRNWERRVEPVARRLLVLMGGSDPENVSDRVIKALDLAGVDLEVTIVAGGSNPHIANLREYARKSGRISVISDAVNIAELMAEADLAVSAAGSTCWELCFLGVPSLLIDVAPNQTALANALEGAGCAIHVSYAQFSAECLAAEVNKLCAKLEMRQRLSTRGRQLVDGEGGRRVCETLVEQLNCKTVVMVEVSSEDRQAFLQIAMRHFQELSPTFLPQLDWKQHYFESVTKKPRVFAKWILYNGQRAGFIVYGLEDHRFLPRLTGMIYELYVSPQFRRLGIARQCALQVLDELAAHQPSKIQLEVVEGNAPARSLWMSLGFERVAEHFVLKK